MIVNVNNIDLDIKRTVRVDMKYEDITGKSFDVQNLSQHSLIDLFIAAVKAAQERQGEKEMSKEEVMRWIEEDPIRESFVSKFGLEYADQYIKYLELVKNYYSEESKKKKKVETKA